MQAVYALSATVFASIFLIAVMMFGGDTARYLAAIAALLIAWSQFVVQDQDARLRRLSVVLVYIAMGFAVAALITWA